MILMKKGSAKLLCRGMLDYFRKTTPLEEAKSECHFCGYIIPGSYVRVRAHLFKETDKGTSVCSAVTPEMLEELCKEYASAKAAEASS
jgi:hypothetical protein